MEAFSDVKRKNNNLIPCTSVNKKPYHERAVKAVRSLNHVRAADQLQSICIYLHLLDIMTHRGVVREKRFACNKQDTYVRRV